MRALQYLFGKHQNVFNFQPHHSLEPSDEISNLATTVIYDVYENALKISGLNIELRELRGSKEITLVKNNYRPVKKALLPERSLSPAALVAMHRQTFLFSPSDFTQLTKKLRLEKDSDRPRLVYTMEVYERKRGCATKTVFAADTGVLLEKDGNTVDCRTVNNLKKAAIEHVKMERQATPRGNDSQKFGAHGELSLVFCKDKLARIEVPVPDMPECLTINGKKIDRQIKLEEVLRILGPCDPPMVNSLHKSLSSAQCNNKSMTVD